MIKQNVKARCSLCVYSEELSLDELKGLLDIISCDKLNINISDKWCVDFLFTSNFEDSLGEVFLFMEKNIFPKNLDDKLQYYILITFLDRDSINNNINITKYISSFLYHNSVEMYINI